MVTTSQNIYHRQILYLYSYINFFFHGYSFFCLIFFPSLLFFFYTTHKVRKDAPWLMVLMEKCIKLPTRRLFIWTTKWTKWWLSRWHRMTNSVQQVRWFFFIILYIYFFFIYLFLLWSWLFLFFPCSSFFFFLFFFYFFRIIKKRLWSLCNCLKRRNMPNSYF